MPYCDEIEEAAWPRAAHGRRNFGLSPRACGATFGKRDHDPDEVESDHDLISLFDRDFSGKPASTFPNHALASRAFDL
jgi:hypothetical protein